MSRQAATTLDAYDRKILDILQKDNTLPQHAIGEAVNLSGGAVNYRIKRMVAQGCIQANVAVLDPAVVGHSITIFVEVEVAGPSAEHIDRARREFSAAREVQQCYYMAADANFLLIVVVPTMADYDSLTRRLLLENKSVVRFRSSVVIDRVKAGLHIST